MNPNQRSFITRPTDHQHLPPEMYFLTKSSSLCQTPSDDSCRSKFMFSSKQYVLITTPNNGHLHGWNIELSFAAILIIYIAILGVIMIIIFLILKFLNLFDADTSTDSLQVAAVEELAETTPMLMQRQDTIVPVTYGTTEGDVGTASCSSSEDLYSAKLCVICYEEPRNCFFVPCGHCATCNGCAKKLMEAESKICPICRKFIRKTRRFTHVSKTLPV